MNSFRQQTALRQAVDNVQSSPSGFPVRYSAINGALGLCQASNFIVLCKK